MKVILEIHRVTKQEHNLLQVLVSISIQVHL